MATKNQRGRSDSELEKVNDQAWKRSSWVVNPSNPASVRPSWRDTLQDREIANRRPELILLTDDVYGTFADNYFISDACSEEHNSCVLVL